MKYYYIVRNESEIAYAGQGMWGEWVTKLRRPVEDLRKTSSEAGDEGDEWTFKSR
jgi:hypothetical protein